MMFFLREEDMGFVSLGRCWTALLACILCAGCDLVVQAKTTESTEPMGSARSIETNDPAKLNTQRWPQPIWYRDRNDDTMSCHNGILRIRPSKVGIIWFDFYHPGEGRWYVNKNNLNLMTLVPGSPWQNTELDHVQPTVEVISESADELVMRYHFSFPNGARIYTDLSLRRGSPSVTFELHQEAESARITGYQWHVTFGQAEAVDRLDFDGNSVMAKDLTLPLPGGRVEVQYHKFIRDLVDLEFRLSGKATQQADPNNPWWMTRVLGLKQRVTWGKPMRPQDHFAFEARDVPWQPDWGVPKTVPWIEGLWFIRNDTLIEGDRLTYSIDNLEDYVSK
jgi:hypothetical protein